MKIVWIASYPKSGNTWIRAFLEAYDTGRLDINHIKSTSGDKHNYFWDAVGHRNVMDMTPTELACIRPAVLCHMIQASHTHPIYLKTHNCNALLEDIPMIPPKLTMGAIYLVRDPRDVVLSYAKHFGCTVDKSIDKLGDETHHIGGEGRVIRHYVSSWMNHVHSWTADAEFPVCLIRYEDLLDRPREIFDGLLRFLEKPIDEGRLTKAIELCDFHEMQAQEAEHGFVENPRRQETMFFRRGKAGYWKNELTPEQVKRVEEACGNMMRAFGYTRFGHMGEAA